MEQALVGGQKACKTLSDQFRRSISLLYVEAREEKESDEENSESRMDADSD